MQFCAVSLSLSFCFCMFVCLPCVFVAQSRQSAATPARPLRLSHFILLCIARHLYSCAQCREHVLLCCVVLCCAVLCCLLAACVWHLHFTKACYFVFSSSLVFFFLHNISTEPFRILYNFFFYLFVFSSCLSHLFSN